ncbi:MAG: hypothetical protein QW116_06555 [Zestosphaera sp.]
MGFLLLLLVLASLFVLLTTHASSRLKPSAPLILLAYLVTCISFLMHAPFTETPLGLMGLKYSDVVHGVFHIRFSPDLAGDARRLSELWFNVDAFNDLVKRANLCPIPYVDYMFEYPPLVGFLWYVTTCTSFTIANGFATTTSDFFSLASSINYVMQASILAGSAVLTLHTLRKLASYGGRSAGRALLFLVLPSTILYMTYNWDLIASCLAAAALYAFLRGKRTTSGMLLGLSVSSKLLTGGLLIPLTSHLLREARGGSSGVKQLHAFLAAFAVGGLTPFMAVYFLSREGLMGFITHHASWYCENCVYALVVPDIFSPVHRCMYAVLGPTLLALVAFLSYRRPRDMFKQAFTSVGGVVVLNYVFTPQMILMVTPFALMALDGLLLHAYVAADVVNSLLIVAFFEDATLRSIISGFTPINTDFNPWTIDSPTQWLAMVRNALLLASIVLTLIRAARPEPRLSGGYLTSGSDEVLG